MLDLSINFESYPDAEKVILFVGLLEDVQIFLDTTDLRFVASEDLRSVEKRLSTVIIGINHISDKTLVPLRIRKYILQNTRNARNELFNALDSQEYTEKDRRVFYSCLSKCQDFLSNAVWRLRPIAKAKKETKMTGLEPIAVATLTKAIDFLFNQAGVILDEIRENRRKSGETVDAPPGQPEGTLSTRAELESLQPKTIILKDTQQEIEHCLKQIYQYRSNQRIILEQISHVGGIPRASIGQINDLSSQDEELKKSIQKLKNLVEQVYGQKLRIVGLE